MRLLLAPPAALAVALLCAAASATQAAEPFVVIVNPSVPGSSIKRSDLAAVFLKKAPRWGSGGMATPVDQSGTSAVRRAFSDAVVQQPVAQVVQYWQKLMFSSASTRPPPVKGTDAEVIEFVAKTPGAVGYVGAGAALPPGVKALTIIVD